MSDDRRILQQILLEQDPSGWRLLIGCMLLNQTTRRHVDGIWPQLFERYPTSNELGQARIEELVELLRPLGLQNRRAKTIRQFSLEWNKSKLRGHLQEDVLSMKLTGVGEYARDSWLIFHDKDTSRADEYEWPGDKELRTHLGKERLMA